MQHFALPLVVALLGASDAPPAPPRAYDGQPLATMREWRPEDFMAGSKCRDSNLPAAGNPGGQPLFERGPATADMGQYIYAVDRRIDGCSVVMVMSEAPPPDLPFGRIRISPEQKAELSGKR